MPLTDLQLRALPFEDGQRDHPDIPGMFVRVGKKTKTFMLTLKDGERRRRLSLGHYPDLSLAKAREKARDLQAEARLAKSAPITLTFEAASEQFKRLHVPTMRPLTQRECTRVLSTRFTMIAKRPLTTLKTSEIASIIDSIKASSERRSAFIWLRVLMTWCYQRGYLDENPLARLKPPPASRPRERVLSETELVRVWRASLKVPCADYGGLIRLLILSAQRRGQWQQFRPDFIEGETVVFPAKFMKAARLHTLPLTNGIRREIGDHTFKGWNEDYQKRQLDRLADIPHFTCHDLRRSAATHMASPPISAAPHVIERILAHQSGMISGIAAVYNRASYLLEMREALQNYETWLQALLPTSEGTHG